MIIPTQLYPTTKYNKNNHNIELEYIDDFDDEMIEIIEIWEVKNS